MREPLEFRRGLVVSVPLPIVRSPTYRRGIASVGCVLAVFETCSSSVFAILVGSAAVIRGASRLRTVAFWRGRQLSGLPLSLDLQQFLGLSQCRDICS